MTGPLTVGPDDEVYQVKAVWLGPRGYTFPWTARYQAYAVWIITFGGVLTTEWATPLTVGAPPIWEACLSVLATYAVMGLVDHERPARAVWQTLRADLTAPRHSPARTIRVTVRATARRGGTSGTRPR